LDLVYVDLNAEISELLEYTETTDAIRAIAYAVVVKPNMVG
jgi:hypothetical protein